MQQVILTSKYILQDIPKYIILPKYITRSSETNNGSGRRKATRNVNYVSMLYFLMFFRLKTLIKLSGQFQVNFRDIKQDR